MTMRRLAWIGIALLGCAGDARDGGSASTDVADTVATSGTPAVPAASDSGPARLTPDGWGPLRIGMTRAQVVAAAGEDANPELVGGAEPEMCDQFRPTGAPEGMLLMVERDTLTRITISRDADVRTDRGFGIGDSASTILAAYGSAATSSPHKYVDAPAAYITVWTVEPGGSAPARGIVYEIGADGRVMHVHAGGPSITYVEGCA